jgi:hypothetical protein
MRERRIFEARRLVDDPVTLEDLATEFGGSQEQVRQIEVRAFEKVQKAVKNRGAATGALIKLVIPRGAPAANPESRRASPPASQHGFRVRAKTRAPE